MEEIRKGHRTACLQDVMEIVRNPNSGFDPEPVTISEVFAKNTSIYGSYPAIVSKEGRIYSYRDYYDIAEMFSKSLVAMGLHMFDVICVIGFTSPEYLFSLHGSWMIGCVTAGIYTTNSPEACHYILERSNASICVCQGGANASKIASIRKTLRNLKAIVVYWPDDGMPDTDDSDGYASIYEWKQFLQLGVTIRSSEIQHRIQAVRPGNCASLIYTSGTTGEPKGVMISHDNAMFNAQSCREPFLLDDNDRFVSYLPMNHIAAQFLDVIVPCCNRTTVYMAQPDALQKSLAETLQKVRPTFFLAVPRVWEKFGEGITHSILRYSWFKRQWMKWCRRIGTKTCLSRQYDHSFHKSILYNLANRTCFEPIRRSYGLDKAKQMIVCAAPVTEETLNFFASFDIPLLDLYGQSEGTGPVTTNTLRNQGWKLFTSGRSLPGIECRVDPYTSELQYRGRQTMMGYLKMPRETMSSIDEEGWIHTGDQAKIDVNGFITITGRLKELIVTAGGENISPVPIENKILELCPILANCVVIGDKRKFLSCLVSLKTVFNPLTGHPTEDLTAVCIEELGKRGIEATTVGEAKQNDKVHSMIEEAIQNYNKTAVSRAQNIRKWILLDHDLSISTGELTATLKLRRNVVQSIYQDKINRLYE